MHMPPAKCTCVRLLLSELNLNIHFNHLEVETEQDKQMRHVAEVMQQWQQWQQWQRQQW